MEQFQWISHEQQQYNQCFTSKLVITWAACPNWTLPGDNTCVYPAGPHTPLISAFILMWVSSKFVSCSFWSCCTDKNLVSIACCYTDVCLLQVLTWLSGFLDTTSSCFQLETSDKQQGFVMPWWEASEGSYNRRHKVFILLWDFDREQCFREAPT